MEHYFAYGSNMNFSQMERRCPNARILCKAFLPDWKYFINSSGYAGIEQSQGALVYGGLWALQSQHWKKLDLYEAVEQGFYKKIRIQVFTEIESRAKGSTAWVYLSNDYQYGTPSEEYQAMVIQGAQDLDLLPGYMQILAKWADSSLEE
ncbi:MAG: gamma-glutamylcyclotransferase [Opitutales bacterium]|nr:gamma-glutamylcyclotransferase [Opitutales bacterium]